MSAKPAINFYIDRRLQYPTSLENYWQWQTTTKGVGEWWGVYHWVLQSYLALKHTGLNCRLVSDVPKEGIVVSHVKCFKKSALYNSDLFKVYLRVDGLILPGHRPDLSIVHSPSHKNRLLDRYYIPPWPQIDLIPREEIRGHTFRHAHIEVC